MIHHRYASITNVAINRKLNRIALTYNVIKETLGTDSDERFKNLRELLEYIYKRIAKLDEERQYARFYCPELLLPFRETTVQIEITAGGEFLELGLSPIVLSDKVIPEGNSKTLPQIDEAYDPSAIVDRVRSKIDELTPMPGNVLASTKTVGNDVGDNVVEKPGVET